MKWLSLLLIVFSLNTSAQDVEARREGILNLLNEELAEVVRLSKQQDNKNPSLLLRIAEINLEKARLIKEKENDQYLAVDPAQRAKKPKESYFQNSKAYFLNAQKICLKIVDEFPRYKSIGDVYYILAYNFKEFNQDAKAQKYFALAIKATGGKNITKTKAEIALAEMYYNERQYSKAVPLYEKAINQKDKWWTKDAFNLAWCYYKTGKTTEAIELMLDVFNRSSNGQYVDVSNLALRDLGLFYAEAGRSEEAISFYKKIGKNFSEQLIKLSKYLMDQNKTTQAEKCLEEALKYETNEGVRKDIFLTQLNLFDKFGKFESHLKTTRELQKLAEQGALSNDDLEVFKVQAQKMGALLQRQAVSTTYKHKPELRKKKAEQSAAYFGILASFEKGKGPEASYLQAETMYGSENYEEALVLYEKSYDVAALAKDTKFAKLSVEGMLACLSQPSVPKKTKDRYYEKAYVKYLSVDTTSSRAQEIYEKLYLISEEKKDIASSEKILEAYHKNFPQDITKHEKMLEGILTYYSKNKKPQEFKAWINRINSGEYKVTKGFANKLRTELTAIQLADAQISEGRGDSKAAIENYFRVFKSTDSTPETRRSAAYNLSVLFFKADNDKQYYHWGLVALNNMSQDEIRKYEETFSAMSLDLFYRQEFKAAIDLSEKAIEKLCKISAKTKAVHFRVLTQTHISEGSFDDALREINKGSSCSVDRKVIQESEFLLLEESLRKERYGTTVQILSSLEKNPELQGKLIKYFLDLRNIYKKIGRTDEANNLDKKINDLSTLALKNKTELPQVARDNLAHKELLKMESIIRDFNQVRLSFPENVYADAMKRKFNLLAQMADVSEKVFATGSGKGIVKAALYKTETQQKFVKEVREFTPPGKDENYVTAFRKDMIKTTEPILKDSYNLIEETRNAIIDQRILSYDSDWFMSKNRFPIKLEYRHIYSGITMDRGGKQ